MAWLLALASPEVEVLGITVTHGNVGLPLTVHNAGVTLFWPGRRVRACRTSPGRRNRWSGIW